MKKIIKCTFFVSFIGLLVIHFFTLKNVFASNSFTTCTLTEGSYIRSDAGSDIKYTDADGKKMLVNSPKRLEVLDSKVVNGQEYKKIKANYYSNNYTGWISTKYLTDFKTYELDGNYANQLRNAGFPETYILTLQKLHAVYPNWNFVPSKLGNGLDFNTAVDNEYVSLTKNLINSPIVSLRSTDGDSYSNGNFKAREGSSWYSASRQTIAFYMDPRNWLFDASTAFMFEDLSYNNNYESTYPSLVKSVLNGSFMNDSAYIDYFISAGKQYNISPVHLASRALQEQGTSGSVLSLGRGYNGNYVGYYNFFNIGTGSSNVINNGFIVAKNNGWDSPYKSILGGAKILASNYIAIGQSTLYYQKFNTIYSDNNSLYTHQYMTNVRACVSESYSTYSSYKKLNVVNSNFTFKIPIYQNLPSETSLYLSQNVVPSNNPTETKTNSTNQNNSVISNLGYNTTSTTVSGVSEGTKASNIIDNAKNTNSDVSVQIKDKNGNNVSESISTGNTITITKNNQTSIYILVVSGDINGDGKISLADLALVKSNLLGRNNFDDTNKQAADINKDGKVSLADLALIKSHLLGINKIR